MYRLLVQPAVMACAVLALSAPIASTPAQAQAPMTLEQAMALAKPAAFGTAVFSAWWSADGRQLVYQTFPAGATEPATYSVAPDDGSVRALDAAAAARVDPDGRQVDSTGQRIVFIRGGVVLRDLSRDEGVQLTTDATDSDPRFSADGTQVFLRRGADWWVVPTTGPHGAAAAAASARRAAATGRPAGRERRRSGGLS